MLITPNYISGYANYAERALQGSMAGTPGAVKDFLHELHDQLRPVVREEYYQIEKFKVNHFIHVSFFSICFIRATRENGTFTFP